MYCRSKTRKCVFFFLFFVQLPITYSHTPVCLGKGGISGVIGSQAALHCHDSGGASSSSSCGQERGKKDPRPVFNSLLPGAWATNRSLTFDFFFKKSASFRTIFHGSKYISMGGLMAHSSRLLSLLGEKQKGGRCPIFSPTKFCCLGRSTKVTPALDINLGNTTFRMLPCLKLFSHTIPTRPIVRSLPESRGCSISLFPPFASPAPRRSFSHFSRCKKEALRRGRRRNEWVWFPVPLSCSQWCEKEQRFSLRPPQTQSNIGRSRQKQKHRPSSSISHGEKGFFSSHFFSLP